jgi:hypothetical protein
MTSDDVWDDNPPGPPSTWGELPGTYVANPDSSFSNPKLAEDKPHILYRSSERSQETMWNNIKVNEWYYLSLYVSNF